MLSKYHLPNKLDGEKIIRIMRRDLFILFKKIIGFLFLIILPLLFFYFIILSQPELMRGEVSYPVIILCTSAYYLFIWLFFFFSFIDYYLDVWIITSERIINIEQKGFFSRVISEQKLFRIQDVTSEVNGLFPTIMNYGDVFVQTAGTKVRFKFREVPNPNNVRDTIIKLVERKKREARAEEKKEKMEKIG
jgi:hypothetical protein